MLIKGNKGRKERNRDYESQKERREGGRQEGGGGRKRGRGEYFALEGFVPRLRRTESGQLSPPPVPPKQEVGNN